MCVVDLDQCIYPRFTQTTLGALLLLSSLKEPYRRFLPQLLSGAAYIVSIRTARILGKRPTNEELMRAFCRVITGLPLSRVWECSYRLPGLGPQIWKQALSKIGRRMKVFLLTFSIEPVARAYGEVRNDEGERIFRGFRGTPLRLRGGEIEGCDVAFDGLTPEAKLRALEEMLQSDGFNHPLIIGHGEDERLMARRAAEMGGGSIGLARRGKEVRDFELVLRGDGWREIAESLK